MLSASLRDLLRVLGPVSAPFAEFDHAPPTDVRIALDLADPRAVPVDVVEHQPLAERQIAERELFGAEPPDDGVEEHRSRHRQIGASRVHHRNARVVPDVRIDDALAETMKRLGDDPAVPHIVRAAAVVALRPSCRG